MFVVWLIIAASVGASIGGLIVGAGCVGKNADLQAENDFLRGGGDAQ
jgi:hypothetical protein